MNILQVIETAGPGGAETVFATLSTALRDRGHMIRCATPDGTWLPHVLRQRGLARVPLRFSGAFDLRLLQQLVRVGREDHVNVIHGHLFDGSVYAAAAARILGVPCVVTLHGHVDAAGSSVKARLKRRWLLRSTRAIVAVSEALRADCGAAFGASADKFQVIYNGVESRVSRTTGERSSNAIRLVSIGNIRRPKGYPILLQTVAELRSRGIDVNLSIAGEPDRDGLFEELHQQCAELGIANQVTFLGFVESPESLLATADCFILSSFTEGFSLATVEAMHAGVPVVATMSGGPEEILEHRKTGLLVPVGSSTALADAVQELLGNPSVTRSMVEAARLDARDRFGVPAMVDAYESLYRRVLTTPDPSSADTI